MKKVFFIIILLTIAPLTAKSQWRFLHDFGAQLDRISALHFLDLPGPPRIGFVGINDPSQVWKTTDGGLTWYQVGSSNGGAFSVDGLTDVAFKDSLTGWVTQDGSYISGCYKTTDGGETWNPLPSAVNDDCLSIYYHRATDRLFAAQSNVGPGLVSSDEGTTWQDMDFYFNGGCAFSEDSIGIMEADVIPSYEFPIVFTTDGGTSWASSNNSPPVCCYHPLAIWGTKTFFITGDSGQIYRSDDGGENWTFLSLVPGIPDITGSGNFIFESCQLYGDLQHIYTQTSYGVFVSTDEGLSWQSLCGPGNYMQGWANPIGFYAKGSYIYAALFNAGYGHPMLWLDTTGTGSLSMSVYLKSNSISARSGDTINIPVYLSGQSWALYGNTSLNLPFVIDTNMLTPVGFIPSMTGLSFDSLSISHDTVLVNVEDSAFTLDSEKVIGYLRCVVYLSDTLQSSVILASPQVTSQDPNCLALSTTTDAVNISITSGCDDSLFIAAMNNTLPFVIESINPNPASASIVINLSSSASINYTLFDALGRTVISNSNSASSLTLDVSNFASGIYYLQLSEGSYVQSRSIAIER